LGGLWGWEWGRRRRGKGEVGERDNESGEEGKGKEKEEGSRGRGKAWRCWGFGTGNAPLLVAARAAEVCCMIVLVTTNLKGEGFDAEGEVRATRRERRVDCLNGLSAFLDVGEREELA